MLDATSRSGTQALRAPAWPAREAILACFRPMIRGRPVWLAQYLAQGLCRVKWLAAAGIVLWILQAIALSEGPMRALYEPAARQLAVFAPTLIFGCVAIGIAGAVAILLTGRRGASIAHARVLVVAIAMTTVASESLLFGFSGMAPSRIASLDLTLLIVFAILPLGAWTAFFVFAFASLVVVGSALLSGHVFTRDDATFALHPMSFAALGAVASRWYVGAFRSDHLARLRLQRHMRQVERQKRLIERQRDESERQHQEIARQRSVLFQALSSALTAPVAHAYVERGGFASDLRTVCVLACDAVGFSDTCRKLQPERVVFELENFFREFDRACLRYRLEPLRAQGDSRIAIAGLWADASRSLQQEAISAVLAMLYFRSVLPGQDAQAGEPARGRVLWPARMGICLGPACCGVIDTGISDGMQSNGRLWFDVWGDTVNLAARIQQAAMPNQLLVRESVLWETCGLFDHGPIHELQVKTTRITDVAEIVGIKRAYRDEAGLPNEAFWDVFNDRSMRPVRPDPAGTVPATVN